MVHVEKEICEWVSADGDGRETATLTSAFLQTQTLDKADKTESTDKAMLGAEKWERELSERSEEMLM